MPNVDEVKSELRDAGWEVEGHKRLPNDSGEQLRLRECVVNVYDKGTYHCQGKRGLEVKAVLDSAFGVSSEGRRRNKVFVVYGHDQKARDELEGMLRRWGLEPLFLDQLPSEGLTIIEKLEKYRAEADFAVVLATPDDQGHRADKPDEVAYRARQNVVLELGIMLAILGRKRVAILLKDASVMERPSDIQGLLYLPFTDSVKDVTLPLAKEMNQQGFRLDLARL